jgi:hypothetical protein
MENNYDIVVEKSTGRIGIKIGNHPYDSRLIDVLIKAATEDQMSEMTCGFAMDWEPLEKGKHYYRVETSEQVR